MFNKSYTNFVKPESSELRNSSTASIIKRVPLSGKEAKEIYLNEVKETFSLHSGTKCDKPVLNTSSREQNRKNPVKISDKDLFLSVQNDDVNTLKLALDACPDNVNKLDDYGWSLLMIACQANSTQSVKELLNRGVNTSVRDKAGNSAQSLVIKNKNYSLAEILLSNKSKYIEDVIKSKRKCHKDNKKREFHCELCNIQTNNKEYHLSSTIHNINLSKDKKTPTNYVIPESNKGYQIMLKVGWDKESGLGPDGSGQKYPIKTVQKQDRKGLGVSKRMLEVDSKTETSKHKNRKTRNDLSDRQIEINFRRQFY